jgi:hypothetical protein
VTKTASVCSKSVADLRGRRLGITTLVVADGVYRYHNRLPNTDLLTRDHRLEQLSTGDLRAALCAAEPSLPEGAPAYIVFASWEASNWSEVEAGLADASALLQASSMGLAGHLAAAGAADDIGNRTADGSDASRSVLAGLLRRLVWH